MMGETLLRSQLRELDVFVFDSKSFHFVERGLVCRLLTVPTLTSGLDRLTSGIRELGPRFDRG